MEGAGSRRISHKVVLIGPESAGKTSLIVRYSNDEFEDQGNTIGTAYVPVDIRGQGGDVHLDIWDTAGQERFRSLVPQYARGAAAVLLVFDIHSSSSFQEVHCCLRETRRIKLPDNTVWFLVANKSDIAPGVGIDDIRAWAAHEDLHFVHTSAKTGENVSELFEQVARMIALAEGPTIEALPVEAPGDSKCC